MGCDYRRGVDIGWNSVELGIVMRLWNGEEAWVGNERGGDGDAGRGGRQDGDQGGVDVKGHTQVGVQVVWSEDRRQRCDHSPLVFRRVIALRRREALYAGSTSSDVQLT